MKNIIGAGRPWTSSSTSEEVVRRLRGSGGCLAYVSNSIIGVLEHAFFSYGKTIARMPFFFILFCLIVTAFCCIGLTNFTQETRPFKLWTPEGSESLDVMEWQEENFPSDLRVNMAIYEAENVLDKYVLLEMLRVHEVVVQTERNSATWDSVCAKVPTLSIALFGRRRRDLRETEKDVSRLTSMAQSPLKDGTRHIRQADDDEDDDLGVDWSTIFARDSYCEFLESMEQACLESSILEVFGYDRGFLSSLSQEQIIRDINTVDTSDVTGFPINITGFLGNVEKDGDGQIIKAGASRQTWFTKINRTAIGTGKYVNDAGTGSQVDRVTYEWEEEFIKNILNDTERPKNVSLYLMASSSFGAVSGASIQDDLQYLSLGFGVVFIYIIIMLGRFNMVEQRPLLSLLGLSCVGLAVGVSYGICSAMNIPYGPVNSILPFLLLGLGIDDMFVIMQAWNNLTPQEQKQELGDRVGCALKHAGVSITVTSVTDFVAFAVGSTTVLPALRSFCLYAAVGIASIFFFQATFFVACLSLDQRRLEDHRQGLLFCWRLKNWTPSQCSQRDLCQTFFGEVYAKFLCQPSVKVAVLLATAVLLSVSSWGLSNLRQEFDPIWFLPQDSYLYEFFTKQRYFYPSSGDQGTIYFGNISFLSELSKIEDLTTSLKNSEYIVEVDSWYDKYKRYWKKQGYQVPDPKQTEDDILDQLTQFLYSPSGSAYRNRNFRFSSDLNCTEKAPAVTASSVDFKYRLLSSSREEIKAMESTKAIVRNANITGYVRAWSRAYAEWETNQVIAEELYRNMGLALAVVFVVTLILIASLPTSLMVLTCVFLTLVDVGALMHWWGLTIDTVSCIDLVLAIGLCVDYAAHVGHTFMTKSGTRDERVRQAVGTIGPAVLNGGFSTFLSFVFLANSTSHVFLSFFKIFFAVCVYGLYHGLVFLPVLLSLLGPAPYATVAPSPTTSAHTPAGEKSAKTHPIEQNNGVFIEKVIHSETPVESNSQQEVDGDMQDVPSVGELTHGVGTANSRPTSTHRDHTF
ncbi:patched domain-containing protein 3-like [Panulirus ornatus]|uniref:patched domain-containing protein 3-like n=1 Tax=Panulirus ornatus TaxID=150431 RepID=UPI003A8634B8